MRLIRKFFDTRRSLKRLRDAVTRRDVPAVVELLQQAATTSTTSSDAKICRKALESLWNLSAVDDLRHYMLQNGVIDIVLDCMECFKSVPRVQIVAAGVICNVDIDPRQVLPSSRSDRDVTSLFSMIGDTTETLLKFVRAFPRDKLTTSRCIWILRSIAHEEQGIQEILRYKGVEEVLAILAYQINAPPQKVSLEVVKNATGFLWNMSDNTQASEIIVKDMGVEGLVSIMKRFVNHKVQVHITGIFTNLVSILQNSQDRHFLTAASVDALLKNASDGEVVGHVLDIFYLMSSQWPNDSFVECMKTARVIPTLSIGMVSASTIFSSTILLKDILSYDNSSGDLRKIFLLNESHGLPFLVQTVAKLSALFRTSTIRDLLKLIRQVLCLFPATCLSNPIKFAHSSRFYSHVDPYNDELNVRY